MELLSTSQLELYSQYFCTRFIEVCMVKEDLEVKEQVQELEDKGADLEAKKVAEVSVIYLSMVAPMFKSTELTKRSRLSSSMWQEWKAQR